MSQTGNASTNNNNNNEKEEDKKDVLIEMPKLPFRYFFYKFVPFRTTPTHTYGFRQLYTLIVTSLGFVAALAWNEAMKALFAKTLAAAGTITRHTPCSHGMALRR